MEDKPKIDQRINSLGEIEKGEAKATAPKQIPNSQKEIKEKYKQDVKDFKKNDKEAVKKFVENSKKSAEQLKRNGYTPPIKRSYLNLIKFFLFLMVVITAVLLYRTYYPEDFQARFDVNLSCGDVVNTCAEIPKCPEQKDCVCENNCDFPNTLEIKILNGTN